MVVIRLARGGSKKKPFYHIVAADKRCSRDGRFIERLGYFNPLISSGDARISCNLERVQHWISVGAQMSQRVAKVVAELQQKSA